MHFAPRQAARFLIPCVIALSPLSAGAQQPPPLAGIAHVAIRVHDLAASLAFYKALGFEQAFDLRRNDIPYESFLKINDHQFLELYPVDEKNPQSAFLHVCFEGNDLEAIHNDYVAHGLTPISVRKAGAGNMLFTMPGPLQPIGPDGKAIPQNIEYTQYMPGSLHSNNAGKAIGPDRIADRLLGVALAFTDLDSARSFYINQLSFKPLPGEPMTLHLPGNSGDEIQLVPDTLGQHARLILESTGLGKAGRHLGHEHIPFQKLGETLIATDPDGNQIVVQQR